MYSTYAVRERFAVNVWTGSRGGIEDDDIPVKPSAEDSKKQKK